MTTQLSVPKKGGENEADGPEGAPRRLQEEHPGDQEEDPDEGLERQRAAALTEPVVIGDALGVVGPEDDGEREHEAGEDGHSNLRYQTIRERTAKRTSSALLRIPRLSIIRYLWKATVRAVIPRIAATSFMALPSARSWRTSRSRGVR